MKNLKFDATLSEVNTGRNDWKANSDQWAIQINGVPFDFWTGTGLRDNNTGKPLPPKIEDILDCIFSDARISQYNIDDDIVSGHNIEKSILTDFSIYIDEIGEVDALSAVESFLDSRKNARKLHEALGSRFDEIEKLIADMEL